MCKLRRHVFLLFLLLPLYAIGGSLYSSANSQPLHIDQRAYSVGDTLTILIQEASSATARANTDADKSLDIGLGFDFNTNNNQNNRNRADLDISRDFNGGASIERTGRLLARISVSVVEVLPNGEFRIKGKQNIAYNEEEQVITVEGKIRQQDISVNNTVLSSRISDSKITYIGEGLLAEEQKPGFIFQILKWLL